MSKSYLDLISCGEYIYGKYITYLQEPGIIFVKRVFLLVKYQNSIYRKAYFSEACHYNYVTLISNE